MGAGGCGADAPPRRGQGRWVKGGQVSGRRSGGAEGRSLTPGGGRKVESSGRSLRGCVRTENFENLGECGPRGLAGSHPRGAMGAAPFGRELGQGVPGSGAGAGLAGPFFPGP